MDNLLATSWDKSNWKGHKLNLQLFAEGDGEGAGTAGGDGAEGADKGATGSEDNNKTYTQEELDLKLQAEADKRVTEALNTARTKWKSELETEINKKLEEAEKLFKMTEDEKQKHLLSEKEKEIAAKEKGIAVRELKLTAINILTEKKLPITLVDMLLPGDLSAETTKTNIEAFEKVFREEVQKAVDERIKATPPGGGNGDGSKKDISSIAAARNSEHKPELNPWG